MNKGLSAYLKFLSKGELIGRRVLYSERHLFFSWADSTVVEA